MNIENMCEKFRSAFDHYPDPDTNYRLFVRGFKSGYKEALKLVQNIESESSCEDESNDD